MTETSASSRVSVRMPSIAALIGGVVLLASLGAAASWIRQFAADSRTVPVAEHQMALAPNETLLPPARTEARLQESEATQGGVSAPSPTTEQAAARPMPTTPDPLTSTTPPTASVAKPGAMPPPVHSARAPAERKASGQGMSSQGSPAEVTRVASSAQIPWRSPARRVASCNNCGTVEGVRGVRVKGKGSGVGAVTGGVLGGLLGSNIGKGNGRSAMTALGIVGGGIAGHEVEKRMKARTVYEVRVRMDDGRVRMFTRNTRPALGSRVVVEGNRLRSASGRRPVDDDARYVDRKV